MKRSSLFTSWLLNALLMAGVAQFALPASAVVTVVAQYRLGEADGAVTVGAVAASGTQPSVGATTLTAAGTPRYSNAASPAPRPSPLSVQFNGTTDGFRAPGVLSTVTNNFGVEAWVRATSTSGNSQVVYNGNSSTTGWGIFRAGSNWGVLFGGQILATSTSPSVDLNTWTHLALVRDGGTTTLYKNGAALLTTTIAPATPSGAFSIGVASLGPGEFFEGNIDEVRVFTFAPGQFSTADLQTRLSYVDPPMVVPVNSATWLLVGVMLLLIFGAIALRKKPAALQR